MGNWRTVQLKGSVAPEDAAAIRAYLQVDKQTYESPTSEDDIFFLQFGTGLCGLNQWVNQDGTIEAVGNVFERGCDLDNLEEELNILAKKFPSLLLMLHAGDDYESKNCVATFIVQQEKVEKSQPLITDLDEISQDQVMINLMNQLRR